MNINKESEAAILDNHGKVFGLLTDVPEKMLEAKIVFLKGALSDEPDIDMGTYKISRIKRDINKAKKLKWNGYANLAMPVYTYNKDGDYFSRI